MPPEKKLKKLVDRLACMDFHEGSVSHKLIAREAIVIWLKVPKSWQFEIKELMHIMRIS